MLRVVTVLFTLVLSVSVFAADKPLHIIAFGAHPDDAEYRVGGVGAMWAKMGHKVKLVSVTNGDIGHWQMAGGELAQRRAKESKAVAAALGIEYEILDNHDGELEPTLENRRKLTRLIRQWDADVVIGHRPFDYHPDHRNVGVLMQDAAFMVTVPFWCPDVPALKKNPVFLYTADGFQKPYPFKADIVVSIDSVFEQKVKALMNQQSQIFEGGANGSQELVDRMPKDEAGKLDYLTKLWQRRADATRYRAALEKWYGKDRAATIKYVEAFEICEYGAQPSEEMVRRLFPFFDK
jgi:LmbE family N-acetylglucosaminyl deacetylase